MGLNPNPSSSSSSEVELRLYQAFIFSIPILFSIILFLLFYVFYLKRRRRTTSIIHIHSPNFHHQSTPLPITSSSSNTYSVFRAKLQTISVDEDFIRTRDKLCSVCLAEFQIGEELHQLPTCRHVFHADCIRLWLYSSSTCPLCRTPIISERIE